MTGINIPAKEWNLEQLPQHLRMKFSVLDEKGKIKATDSDLVGLQQLYAHLARASMQQGTVAETQTREGITRWDFGELPVAVSQDKHGMQVRLFPALVDKQSSVAIELFESEQSANQAMYGGLRRLLMLSLHQQVEMLRKKLPEQREMALLYVGIGKSADLLEDLILKTFETVFLQQTLPRDEKAFQKLLDSGRAKVVKQGSDIAGQVLETLKAYGSLQTAISSVKAAPLKPVVEDIQKQVAELIYPGFVASTPAKWLQHLPRFLQAAEIRLQRAGPNLKQDAQNTQLMQKLREQYQKEFKQRQQHHESVAELLEYRWLLEELSVSLFAQSLKTSEPVSAKRLEKRWKEITA